MQPPFSSRTEAAASVRPSPRGSSRLSSPASLPRPRCILFCKWLPLFIASRPLTSGLTPQLPAERDGETAEAGGRFSVLLIRTHALAKQTLERMQMSRRRRRRTGSASRTQLAACVCVFGGHSIRKSGVKDALAAAAQPGAMKGTSERCSDKSDQIFFVSALSRVFIRLRSATRSISTDKQQPKGDQPIPRHQESDDH